MFKVVPKSLVRTLDSMYIGISIYKKKFCKPVLNNNNNNNDNQNNNNSNCIKSRTLGNLKAIIYMRRGNFST